MSTVEYLRPKEVRKIFKISNRTIYNWEKAGKLTCIRTRGGERRFLKTDIFPELNVPNEKQKRKGFNSILDAGIQGNLEEVVVTHRDRFCRFDFDIFERIIQTYSNGKIVVLNKTETSPEEEVVKDLLSIITVFSARVHGLRSNGLKRKIKEQSC